MDTDKMVKSVESLYDKLLDDYNLSSSDSDECSVNAQILANSKFYDAIIKLLDHNRTDLEENEDI